MICQISRVGPAQHGSFGRVVPDGPGGVVGSLFFLSLRTRSERGGQRSSEVYAASEHRWFPSSSSRSCLESAGTESYVLGRGVRSIISNGFKGRCVIYLGSCFARVAPACRWPVECHFQLWNCSSWVGCMLHVFNGGIFSLRVFMFCGAGTKFAIPSGKMLYSSVNCLVVGQAAKT